jgi:hypothetical protein
LELPSAFSSRVSVRYGALDSGKTACAVLSLKPRPRASLRLAYASNSHFKKAPFLKFMYLKTLPQMELKIQKP